MTAFAILVLAISVAMGCAAIAQSIKQVASALRSMAEKDET